MKANKLEFEQLQNVSGGGSTNEENSNGFRKTCPLCDTFSWCTKTGNYREGKYFFDGVNGDGSDRHTFPPAI